MFITAHPKWSYILGNTQTRPPVNPASQNKDNYVTTTFQNNPKDSLYKHNRIAIINHNDYYICWTTHQKQFQHFKGDENSNRNKL